MTPEAHARGTRCWSRRFSDPYWQAASQALDDLIRKLMVMHRLLEAEERLPKREPWTDRCNGCSPASARLDNRSKSAGGFPLGPPGGSRPL
jgi:hypothetical protein